MTGAAGPVQVAGDGPPTASPGAGRRADGGERQDRDRLSWRYRCGLGLAAIATQSAVYFAIAHSERPRSATLLDSALDRAIPFVPWTVWWYLPFYGGIVLLALLGLRTRRLFDRALVGVVFVMVVGAAGHLLVGAEYPRPQVVPAADSPSLIFLAWLHRVDPPGNVFPSLHVAHTTALALVLRRERPRLGALAMGMAALLALSTLTTKQHFLVDVLAGLVIGLGTAFLVLRRPPPVDPAAPSWHARS